MKKRLFALLLALLMLSAIALTACTDTGDDVTPPVGTEDPNNPGVTPDVPPDVPEVRGIDVPADRYDATVTPRTGNNATRPLVIDSSPMDGKFSPFFNTTSYDRVIAQDLTALAMLDTVKSGEPVAGIEYASVAYDYEVTQAEDSSSSTYKFCIKNGLTFSDGTPLTIDDVLFSAYVFLDPRYDGAATLYSLDIKGLGAYRAQISEDAYETLAAKINAAGAYDINATYAEGDYWSYLAGEEFAALIYDYVNANYQGYAEDEYGKPYADFTEGDKVAFSMVMWGFGAPSEEDATLFVGASGAEYVIDELTLADYWTELNLGYEGDLVALAGTEAPNDEDIIAMTTAKFLAAEGTKLGGGAAPTSVSGITTGKEVCDDGDTRDYIQFELNGVSPKAIFQLGFVVAPWQYNTSGFAGELNENHVSVDDPAFIQTLKEKNDNPVGAGPYVFVDFSDNVVTLVANENFLLGSPKIATIRVKVIDSGGELDALKTGDVDFDNGNISTTPARVSELSAREGDTANLGYTLVDNDGYGYIGLMGERFPEWEVRKGIAHAMNIQLCVENYYGELASVNYRTMSKTSWAYPDNPNNLFPYDETGETTKALFLEAGYTYDEAANVMYYPADYSTRYPNLASLELDGKPVAIKATLPQAVESHPAGSVFLNAKNVFALIGIELNIEVDTAVLNKLDTGLQSGVEMWAAAWGSGGVEPSMFQIWYSDPTVNTNAAIKGRGLGYLYESGSADQKATLTRLNELIIQADAVIDPDLRKPLFAQALELSSSLALEIPTYQRKNMFAYNDSVINAATLVQPDEVSPFYSPIHRIWEVELLG